jgi:putative flippase GtrA
MTGRKDFILVLIIGAAVGILIQPVLTNTGADALLRRALPAPGGWLRLIIFAFFLALAPLALGIAGVLGRRLPVIYQFAKFAAVGSLNTFIDLGTLNLQTFLSGIPADAISNLTFGTFKTVSFLAATTNSFLWNKLWTFGDKSRPQAETIVKFYLITAVNAFLNVGVATAVKAAGPVLAISPELWVNVVAPVAGIFASFMGNFLGYKFLVFRS